MRRMGIVLFIMMILSGCGRNVPIEDLTITLMLGLDLNDNKELVVSESSPVFNTEAKKNIEKYQLKAKSIRDSRKYFDALETGDVTAAKIQIILVGEKILEHENWFTILDTIYRNPAFSMNSNILMVDGKVSDVLFFEPEEKPQLPIHIKNMIQNNIHRTRAVNTTLQMLHRQMHDKGMTPIIPKIKKDKDIKFAGTALLDKKGVYVDSLNIEESSYLLILQNEKNKELTLSMPMKEIEEDGGIFHKNELSFVVNKIKTKVKTDYKEENFHFNIKIKGTASIVERLFSDEISNNELKEMIAKEMTSKINELIEKFQKHKIDPIGLGTYARAYHYDQFKEVEDNWGEAFSKASVDVSIDIEITSVGVIK